MSKKVTGTIITIVLGAVTFMLNPILFPPPTTGTMPTSGQIMHFMIVGAIESLAFGLGVVFLLFSLPLLKTVPQDKKSRTLWTIISLTWLLVSWWPHDQLHMMIGMDFNKLILIEYGFHVTLILATVIVASSVLKTMKEKTV